MVYGIQSPLQLRIYHHLSPYDQLSLIESTVFPHITLQTHLEESLWNYGVVWKDLQAFLKQIDGSIVGWFPIRLMVPSKKHQWERSIPPTIHIFTEMSQDKFQNIPYLVHHNSESNQFSAFLTSRSIQNAKG